jgi:hypothetical protein
MGQPLSTEKHDAIVSELTYSNKHRTGNLDLCITCRNRIRKSSDREFLIGSLARFVVLRVERAIVKKSALELVCIRGAFATPGATLQLKHRGMDSKLSPKNCDPRNTKEP